MRRRRSCRAFTLIELLIVISILAILIGVSVPPLLRARKNSRESAALQVLVSLRAAETGYKTKVKSYGNLQGLLTYGGCTFGEGGCDNASGYTFTSVAGADDYTIVAIPPLSDMTTYTLNEAGVTNP